MRRLILEFPIDEWSNSKNLDVTLFKNIKTLEILHLLKQDRKNIAVICRIEVEKQESDIESYVKLALGNTAKVQIIEREKNGAFIVFVNHKMVLAPLTLKMIEPGVYIASREFRRGNVKIALIGTVKQLKRTLENLDKSNMHFRILSVTDPKFAYDSPINGLTEKQRRVLTNAFKLGYYDLPRRIDSQQLANRLKLKTATLVVHRRKAERRILAKLLEE